MWEKIYFILHPVLKSNTRSKIMFSFTLLHEHIISTFQNTKRKDFSDEKHIFQKKPLKIEK